MLPCTPTVSKRVCVETALPFFVIQIAPPHPPLHPGIKTLVLWELGEGTLKDRNPAILEIFPSLQCLRHSYLTSSLGPTWLSASLDHLFPRRFSSSAGQTSSHLPWRFWLLRKDPPHLKPLSLPPDPLLAPARERDPGKSLVRLCKKGKVIFHSLGGLAELKNLQNPLMLPSEQNSMINSEEDRHMGPLAFGNIPKLREQGLLFIWRFLKMQGLNYGEVNEPGKNVGAALYSIPDSCSLQSVWQRISAALVAPQEGVQRTEREQKPRMCPEGHGWSDIPTGKKLRSVDHCPGPREAQLALQH